MNVTPYEAYKKYLAIKLHFNSEKYDYFLCKGEVKAKKESFEKRNDKYFFHKITKKFDEESYVKFLVANFIKNEELWVGDLLSEQCLENYYDWKKRFESLEYSFKQDLIHIKEYLGDRSFNDLFISNDGQHPSLVRLVLMREISLETFLIMNKILAFFPVFDKVISEDLVWPSLKNKCLRYAPFLNIDASKFKNILKNEFAK